LANPPDVGHSKLGGVRSFRREVNGDTMSYIEELRSGVGNRPLIMVGAAVGVSDYRGRLLLIRRTDNGCWGLPGGFMEPGERLEDTVRRAGRRQDVNKGSVDAG